MKHCRAGAWLCLIVLLAGNVPAEGKALLDADDVNEAAGMVIEQTLSYQTAMTRCREKYPEGTFAFQIANYVWRADNSDALLVANSIIGTKMIAIETRIQALNDAAANMLASSLDGCMALANKIITKKESIKADTPRAYAFLSAAFSRDAHMAAEWKRGQFESGCVKGYANKGIRNFDQIMASCRCATTAFYGSLTAAERADFDAHVNDLEYIKHSPIVQKLHGAAQTCAVAPH